MTLICNGYRNGHRPHRHYAGSVTSYLNGMAYARWSRTGAIRNITWNSDALTDETTSLPLGCRHPESWMMPQKAGGMSSRNRVTGEGDITDADIWAVKLAIAALTGSGDVSSAIGSLIVQAAAALSGSGTISAADLKAFLNAVASLSGSGEVSDAALTGLGALISALTGTGSVSPTLTGIGELDADLKAYGDLTNEGVRDAVWDAITSQFNESGTMGEVMNNIGAASNPWSAMLDDNNDPGTFGERVQKLLTVAKFLGLK